MEMKYTRNIFVFCSIALVYRLVNNKMQISMWQNTLVDKEVKLKNQPLFHMKEPKSSRQSKTPFKITRKVTLKSRKGDREEELPSTDCWPKPSTTRRQRGRHCAADPPMRHKNKNSRKTEKRVESVPTALPASTSSMRRYCSCCRKTHAVWQMPLDLPDVLRAP